MKPDSSREVVIIGAGGHGQVVADILLRGCQAGGSLVPIGFLDDNEQLLNRELLGLPVLGVLSEVDRFDARFIVAVGDNRLRSRIYDDLSRRGKETACAHHPHTALAREVTIGNGTVICAGVVVNPATRIGRNTVLNTSCTIDHHNTIHDHVHVAPGARLGGQVTVGEGAFIGMGAVITPCRHVGSWSVVAAGSVVVRDVRSGETVIGTPARPR